MRKIILNLAMSLDGYIADPDGGFDWIEGQGDICGDIGEVFDFEAFTRQVDTLVMGSKAYEDCMLSGLETFTGKDVWVATSRDLEILENVSFIQEDLIGRLRALREQAGGDIWLFGGGVLADEVIRADLVDEFIVGIIPILLGSGRTLFKPGDASRKLHLEEVSSRDGIVILRYTRRGEDQENQ